MVSAQAPSTRKITLQSKNIRITAPAAGPAAAPTLKYIWNTVIALSRPLPSNRSEISALPQMMAADTPRPCRMRNTTMNEIVWAK